MPRNRIAEQIAVRSDRGTKQYSLRILGERKAAVREENAEKKSIKKNRRGLQPVELFNCSSIQDFSLSHVCICEVRAFIGSDRSHCAWEKKRRFGAICLTNDLIKGEFLCF
ncbi:hypothetical protein CEXT_511921 [Caerostris extrusa]|uniref:Uncharacterized protein n=1 Tax=Caerostris extrusa TaxID=172846 RepID=A0AAV4NN13_CAEEX|nr:hypothetical protein CEXT_511921 [Caerostris extrusa]